MRELNSLKSSGVGGMGRFDSLVFKKTNINNRHMFMGGDGIPPICLNDLVEIFDQNCTRRNEMAINTLRRFVKFLLENVSRLLIPINNNQLNRPYPKISIKNSLFVSVVDMNV